MRKAKDEKGKLKDNDKMEWKWRVCFLLKCDSAEGTDIPTNYMLRIAIFLQSLQQTITTPFEQWSDGATMGFPTFY